jgi:hypothetical protein
MDTKLEDEKTIFREYVDSPENRVAQFYKNNHVSLFYLYRNSQQDQPNVRFCSRKEKPVTQVGQTQNECI